MKLDITIHLPDGPRHFDTLERLGAYVAQVGARHANNRTAYRDAKVLLGHVLNQIDEQIPYHERGQVYAHFGLHPKTSQHAKKLASEIGDGYGRIDFNKVRALQISRAEGHAEGVPLTRQERAILEAAAETLTSTGLEVLAGVRTPDTRLTREQTHGAYYTVDSSYAIQGNRGQNEPSSFCLPTPSPSAAGGGVDGPASAAGTPSSGLAIASASAVSSRAGASGMQLSFAWTEAVDDRLGTIRDLTSELLNDLDHEGRDAVLRLLDDAIKGITTHAQRKRLAESRARSNEIGDLMETGRSRYRTG